MNKLVDELINNVTTLTLDKQQEFVAVYESGLYDLDQIIQIYEFIRDGLDLSLLEPRFDSYLIKMIYEVLVNGDSNYYLKNLLSYDVDIISRVFAFYNQGNNILTLIDLDNSLWYIEFLLKCLENNFNLDSLKNKCLNYSTIWNLANCIILRYDVDSFLELYKDDLPSINVLDVIRYFIGNVDSPSRLFVVSTCDYVGEDEDSSYVVLASNEREAKLYSCLNGQFTAFNLAVNEIKIDGSNNGIVFYK